MPYGILKVDTITFTNGGADQSITVSGIVASTSGNLTVTGTVSGNVIRGGTTVSGATVTGSVGQFGNLTAVSGVFTTQISGATVTGNVGQFTSVTGGTAGFTTVTGTTVTGTTANFVTVSGATVTGGIGSFTTLTGGVTTITSGVFATGSATNPSISFTSDPNTGIYSPGADQVAISTNGTQRLTVDTAATTSTLPVVHPLGAVGTPSITFTGDLNTGIYSPAADTIAFAEGGVEAMRLDSSGRLGLGTSSPSQLLEIRSATSGGAPATSGTTQNGLLRISQTSVGQCLDIGTNADSYSWLQATNRTDLSVEYPLVINPNGGNVGIGTTSPGGPFDVYEGTWKRLLVTYPDVYTTKLALSTGGYLQSSVADDAVRLYNTANGPTIFATNNTERARIDSSGRLLVGTSTATNNARFDQKLSVVSTGSGNLAGAGVTSYGGTGNGTAPFFDFQRSRGTTDGSFTAVASGDTLGYIVFRGATGSQWDNFAQITGEVDGTPGTNDAPGRLVFSTTADGASSPTERMRITQGGLLLVNRTSSAGGISHSIDATGTSSVHNALLCQHLSSGNDVRGIIASAPNCTTDDGYLFIGGRSGADKFYVRTSGNVQNTNNSYGAISDQTLKQDIVPAGNQWEDIRSLQVKKYRFKDEPDSPLQIGLIAQDVEQISPGLVETSLNREDPSRSTKSIKYSVLYMKAVKALQEAMERIEVLEQRLTDAGIA